MGLMWTIGIIAGLLDPNVFGVLFQIIWFLFILLNAFQGLFIFIGFTCTLRVRKALRNKLFNKKTRRGSTFTTASTKSSRMFSNTYKSDESSTNMAYTRV